MSWGPLPTTFPGRGPLVAEPLRRRAGFYAGTRSVGPIGAGPPVLAYHVPWISAPGVPVEDLPTLPIAGIKDSSGSADRLLDELALYDGATYVGSSALLALAGPMGGAGAILALANVEPETCCRAFGGDAATPARAGRHPPAGARGRSCRAEADPARPGRQLRPEQGAMSQPLAGPGWPIGLGVALPAEPRPRHRCQRPDPALVNLPLVCRVQVTVSP